MSDALAHFAAAPADEADIGALVACDAKDLLALISTLEADEKRAHLEALSDRTFPRPVRKAAGKAAYRLKSAGVSGEWRPDRPAVTAAPAQDLGTVGGVLGPGLSGLANLIVARVGIASGLSYRAEVGGLPAEVQVIGGLRRSELRRILHAKGQEGDEIVACGADLAVRFVDWAVVELESFGAPPPPYWNNMLEWRLEAIAGGADAARASARAHVTPADSREALDTLLATSRLGIWAPPPPAVEDLSRRLDEAIGSPIEIARPAFEQRLRDCADRAADGWVGEPEPRENARRWLELGADIAWGAGEEAAAALLLHVVDQLADPEKPAHELPLIVEPMRRLVDSDACWESYLERRSGGGDPTPPAGDGGGGGIVLP